MRWQGRWWSRNLADSTHNNRGKASVRIEDAVEVKSQRKSKDTRLRPRRVG